MEEISSALFQPAAIELRLRRIQTLAARYTFLEFTLSPTASALRLRHERRPSSRTTLTIDPRLLIHGSPDTLEFALVRFALLSHQRFFSSQIDMFLHNELRDTKELLRQEFSRVVSQHPLRRSSRSDPTLRREWCRIREAFFPDRPELDDYRIRWSPRKSKHCLGSCNVYTRQVCVARPMALPGCEPYLEPLLYHEMCHAALGMPKSRKGRRVFHGPEFRELEQRHPQSAALDAWIESGGWREAVRSFNRRTTTSGKHSWGEKLLRTLCRID